MIDPGTPRGPWMRLAACAVGAGGVAALTYFGLARLLGKCDCSEAGQNIGGAAMLLGAAVLLPITLAAFASLFRSRR